MSHRVRIECQFEIEIEDLSDRSARSVEELRSYGAQLHLVTRRARDAVEATPGVTLHSWSDTAGPASDRT